MNKRKEYSYIKIFEGIKHKIPRGRPLIFRLFLLGGALLLLLWLLVLFSGSGDKSSPENARGGAGSVPVRVSEVKVGDMDIIYRCLGTITPVNTITVRSRVDGELIALHFSDGQVVKEGDLLAEIDPRPYQAQLTQAEGQLARDQALLASAIKDLDRYRVLKEQNSIALQQWDNQKSLVEQYRGAVKMDQGQVDAVRLQLTYCRITAPISGRLGLRKVDPGNIINASDQEGIVVITQLDPIDAVFTITDSQVAGVQKAMAEGHELSVELWDKEQDNLLATGRLLTMDNLIDSTTGTLRLKATFANKDYRLFPNQFVNVRLIAGKLEQVPVVPSAAVQYGNQGPYVYVVGENDTVSLRLVKPGLEESGRIVLKEGVSPGEILVVEGVDRLREGSHVRYEAVTVP